MERFHKKGIPDKESLKLGWHRHTDKQSLKHLGAS